jgi:hypothetical protein
MQIIFAIWGLLGLIINGMSFLTLTGNVGVGTSTYLAVGNLLWIGGMVLFGLGAMFPRKERIEKDRQEGVFRPDGMVGHTPYRELPNGEIEALIQGGNVRFKNLDHLRSMTNAASAPPAEKQDADLKPKFDPQYPIFNPFNDLPAGSKVERHFGLRVAFLPDGSVLGDSDSGPRKFDSFEEWRRSVGE